jgi:hypothetical protein
MSIRWLLYKASDRYDANMTFDDLDLSGAAVILDCVPAHQLPELLTVALSEHDFDDRAQLVRDPKALGVLMEAECTGCDPRVIEDDYSPAALARLSELAMDALLARLPVL